MKEKIISAGIMYFYLRGIMNDAGQISIYTQDTYKCLPEVFYERVFTTFFDEDDDRNVIHMFGVIGISNKIHMIADVVKKGLQNNCQRIIDGHDIRKSHVQLDPAGNSYFRLIQEFVCEMPDHFPYEYTKDGDGWSLSCVWSSNAFEGVAHSLAYSVMDIWLEKETPVMLGKQIMNRSFFMSDFIDRKAIACIPSHSDGGRILLFEGGNRLDLDTISFYKGVSSPKELGFFSMSGINNILMTPAYSYGIHLYPDDISLEWHKVFLYACAISDIKWDSDIFGRIYPKFLDFMKENICDFVDVETLVSHRKSWEAFIININSIREFLVGKDESVLSKDLFQLLNTRYVYLPYLADLIGLENKKANLFSQKTLLDQIDSALSTEDPYQRGLLWENVAEYVLDNIDGWRVTGRRVRAGSQEIDLSVANVSLDDELWQLGSYILVECKNWKKHVNVPQVRNIAYISSMKGNKTALLFAANGVTKDAREEIERLAGTGIYIIVIDSYDLKNIETQLDCKTTILRKYTDLKEIATNNLPL